MIVDGQIGENTGGIVDKGHLLGLVRLVILSVYKAVQIDAHFAIAKTLGIPMVEHL